MWDEIDGDWVVEAHGGAVPEPVSPEDGKSTRAREARESREATKKSKGKQVVHTTAKQDYMASLGLTEVSAATVVQAKLHTESLQITQTLFPGEVDFAYDGLVDHASRNQKETPLHTENLLEDADGLLRRPFCPLSKGGRSTPLETSRCGGLLPSIAADVRSSDDVVAYWKAYTDDEDDEINLDLVSAAASSPKSLSFLFDVSKLKAELRSVKEKLQKSEAKTKLHKKAAEDAKKDALAASVK